MHEVKKYENLTYVIKYPENYDKSKIYPVILGLHGAGGRGTDINIIETHPLINALEKLNDERFIVVMPQCFADTWFEIFEQLQRFCEFIINEPYTDKKRVYLTGASMGSYTSWQLAMTHPEWFSAIAPVCGGGMYWNAARLRNVPVWAFHGMLDEVVKVEESIKMVNAVNRAGGDARLTVFPHDEHNSWDDAFNNPELYKWFLSHVK